MLTRLAIEPILGFDKRRLRDDKNIESQSGAASVVQRVRAHSRLNSHVHATSQTGCLRLTTILLSFTHSHVWMTPTSPPLS